MLAGGLFVGLALGHFSGLVASLLVGVLLGDRVAGLALGRRLLVGCLLLGWVMGYSEGL